MSFVEKEEALLLFEDIRGNCRRTISNFKACEHCPYTCAREYAWKNSAIIVTVDQSIRNFRRGSPGIFNLIIPLRSYFRHPHELRPIVLMFDTEENTA